MEGVNMEGANKRGAHANGGGRRGARVRPFVPRINERSHSICYLRGGRRVVEWAIRGERVAGY